MYTPVMAQRRFHYEQAFEHYLRANRVPYVAVDEAKKALVPTQAAPAARSNGETSQAGEKNQSSGGGGSGGGGSIKSFDFVVYAPQRERNLLVDVKGRMFGSKAAAGCLSNRRMESWVTLEDVSGLDRWQEIFGSGFEATFVFAYCLREISLEAYRREMIPRSRKWGTVHLPREAFNRISRPFSLRPTPTGRRSSCTSSQVVLC
jgi:hypothetical protein